jgi:hypothetical protein
MRAAAVDDAEDVLGVGLRRAIADDAAERCSAIRVGSRAVVVAQRERARDGPVQRQRRVGIATAVGNGERACPFAVCDRRRVDGFREVADGCEQRLPGGQPADRAGDFERGIAGETLLGRGSDAPAVGRQLRARPGAILRARGDGGRRARTGEQEPERVSISMVSGTAKLHARSMPWTAAMRLPGILASARRRNDWRYTRRLTF